MPDGATPAVSPSGTGTKESKDDFGTAQRHFMSTTWPNKPQSEWTFPQRFFAKLNVIPNFPYEDAKPSPVKKVGDPVPVMRKRDQLMTITPWCLAPLLIHYAYMRLTGWTLHPIGAYLLYMVTYQAYSAWTTRMTTWVGMTYGHLDGGHARDGVPDAQDWHILLEVVKVVTIRPLLGVMLAYDRNALPSVSIFLPVKMFFWSITLDFWFYWYHRAMHQVPWLWKYHRTHHMTKHPSSLLSAFADWEQEICDAYVVPLLTYAVLHRWFNFSEWFIATMCVVQAEAGGHSGARVYGTSVMNGWLLRAFRMELSLEDHDLHHRQGYRHLSGNYGKQTLLWDVLFGTRKPRLETADEYVDWNWHVKYPLWVPRRSDVSLFGPREKKEQ